MDVTVVVTPRERFRLLPGSLKSLFSKTSKDVRVIVVDGGAPDHIRREIEKIHAERPFEWIRNEQFVMPNVARNDAMELVDTKYVAFADNDVHYEDQWLEALVDNAERTGAGAVSPVTLFGSERAQKIHHAGGELELRDRPMQGLVLSGRHWLANTPFDAALANNFAEAPEEHHHIEYHCALIDADLLRQVGGHDERLIRNEHIDTSLRILHAGRKLTFEPKSVISYRAFDTFEDEDWPYFLFRWDYEKSVEDAKAFAATWGISESGQLRRARWVDMHRRRAIGTTLRKLPRVLRNSKIATMRLDAADRRILSRFGRSNVEQRPLRPVPAPPTKPQEFLDAFRVGPGSPT